MTKRKMNLSKLEKTRVSIAKHVFLPFRNIKNILYNDTVSCDELLKCIIYKTSQLIRNIINTWNFSMIILLFEMKH